MLENIPREKIVGVVAAGIRPASHTPIQLLCKKLNLPFLVQPKPSMTEDYEKFLSQVRCLKPDLFFVYSYAMLLREDLLSLPSFGGVNIHGGSLPQYRGSNPIQWEIIHREEWAGISLHKLESKIDSGAIYASKKTPILFSDTWVEVTKRISALAEELIQENIAALLDGTACTSPQDENFAVTRRRRTPDDGLFQWSMPCIQIYNLIRALISPLPGAFVIDPTEGRKEFKTFLPFGEIINLKAQVFPFKYKDGVTILADVDKSPKEGVHLILNDAHGRIISTATVGKIRKSEAVVQFQGANQEYIEDFCRKEFEVPIVHIKQ